MKSYDSKPEPRSADERPALDEHEAFQADLSAMLDEELNEQAAARTMQRLEQDAECRDFFSSIQLSLQAHRHTKDPEFLVDQYRTLVGRGMPRALEDRQLVHRLAIIFYQLGKAYVLTGSDPDWRQRVFEQPVEVERMRATSRGWVDGVAVRSGPGSSSSGFDWSQKRHLLNGTLERISAPFEKARRMLDECLAIEDDFEPALLWLAMLDRLEDKRISALRGFTRVFEQGISPTNKAHAAMQLGKMHAAEGDYAEALTYFRWIGLSGELARDRRFFPAGFNAGSCYAHLRRPARAIATFRRLLDEHPERSGDLARFLAGSPATQEVINQQAGFAEALFEQCPELFRDLSTGPCQPEETN